MNIQKAIVTRDKYGYWTHPALEKEFSVLEKQEHLTDKDFFSLEKNLI